MGRLSIVVLFTPEIARQQEFYEKSLGLTAAAASPRWVQFATRDAALALRVLPEGEPARIELGFDVPSLDERIAVLASRGVEVEGVIETSPDCRIARVRDPEGNVIQLVERKKPTTTGKWPRLSHAIINAQAFDACATFYHDALGFKVAEERERWVEFDTGEASLTLHASYDADGLPLAPDQRISFALMDDDLDAWADELRGRGVRFATTPTDEEIGRMAEVEDADGWFVVLRGPEPEVPFEEELALDYADEDDTRMEQIRKSDAAEPGARPGFGAKKLTKKKTERIATKGFDAMVKSRDDERGGFVPGGTGMSRSSGPPRPFTPRPDGPPRPYTPRPDRPPGASGPSRPYTPRPDRPPGASGPSRPYTPRPDRPPGSSGPSRPYTPRPDRPPGAGPRPGGPPRPPRREE